MNSRNANTVPRLFNVFLAIYFILCFWLAWHHMGELLLVIDSIELYSSEGILLSVLPLLVYAYSFAAICGSLKRSPTCIFSLKLSLLFFCFYVLKLVIYSSLGVFLLIFLFAFTILLFSKWSNKIICKSERKIGIIGWCGILMLISPTIYIAGEFNTYYQLKQISKPISVESLNLDSDMICDGYVAFVPMTSWQLDSITSPREYRYTCYNFSDNETNDKIAVISSLSEDFSDRRDQMWFIHEEAPFDSDYFIKQLENCQYSSDNVALFVDSYLYQINYEEIRWIYGTIYYQHTGKEISVSILDYNDKSYTAANVKDFLQSVIIDLRPMLVKD